MTRMMFGRSLALVPLLTLAGVSPLGAQDGLLSPSGGLIFWTIVSFLIVFALLWKFALPHILGAVEAREEKIRELLAAAARDREEAQQALAEQRRELEETRARIQELIAEGRSAGERMRDEMLADARRQADELLARARRDVRQELDRAVEELRAEAVDIALAAAGRLLERNLDEEDNRRLIREFLADLDARSDVPPVPAGV